MILAFEGLDCCGKTTQFQRISEMKYLFKDVVFVPSITLSKTAFTQMHLLEERQIDLWKYLYDPKKLYICDRSPFTSSGIYGQLHNRPRFEIHRYWQTQITCVLFRISVETARRRYSKRGDDKFDESKYEQLHELYNDIHKTWPTVEIDAEQDVDGVTMQLISTINRMLKQ
jgi:thymidylate kinase